MTLRWLTGDCRETLRTLEAGSVQACITSPPYWALRDYGTPPLVWGGDPGHEHEWGAWQEAHDVREGVQHGKTRTTERFYDDESRRFDGNHQKHTAGAFCACGAWLGSLGLEPMPEMYVEHMVEVFREVRRVLRDDGACWINLGCSYAGSGKGPTGHNGIGDQGERQGFVGGRRVGSDKQDSNRGSMKYNPLGGLPPAGFKAKDMIDMPSFVQEALRQDGWYFRGKLPWLKRNCMPSSVRDRPGASLEYVLYLSKSRRTYWDADAVRAPARMKPQRRRALHQMPQVIPGQAPHNGVIEPRGESRADYDGRAFRDSDLFFQSWQGMLLDEDDDPLALVVNLAPLKIAHYAAYPPKLVGPMIKASSRVNDWVLDPFAGAGTTLMVADRLGRNAIGCELSEDYGDMGTKRIVRDNPMFTELETA